MIVLRDSDTGECWTVANGKARPLKDPIGFRNVPDETQVPMFESPTMRFVIGDHYELV